MIRLLNHPWMVGLKNVLVRRGLKDIRYYGVKDARSGGQYTALSDVTRWRLAEALQPDLRRLEALAGLDLSSWASYHGADHNSLAHRHQQAANDGRLNGYGELTADGS